MKMELELYIQEVLEQIAIGNVEVYNEFSLQHELGIYLRQMLPGYKVQFERNVSFFGIKGTIKKEIDIVVYNDKERYAIELKYPLNGQHPEQMFSFVKDIRFVEQLKKNGFDSVFAVTLVIDERFVAGSKIDGIYAYFRDNQEINGIITKPTGIKNEVVEVEGKYKVNWIKNGKYYYYVMKI